MSIKRSIPAKIFQWSCLPCLALAGLLVSPGVCRANEILDFVDTSGGHATGTLYLSDPLSAGQIPGAGSFFDVDGSGPLAAVNLSGIGVWAASPVLFSPFGTLLCFGIVIPGTQPVQAFDLYERNYPDQVYEAYDGSTRQRTIVGQGEWVPRQTASVPETTSTSQLLALSLAGLVFVARRVQTAQP